MRSVILSQRRERRREWYDRTEQLSRQYEQESSGSARDLGSL